jgi:hypothetical protein
MTTGFYLAIVGICALRLNLILLWAGRSVLDPGQGYEFFSSKPTVGTTQHLNEWVPTGVKLPEREAGDSTSI